MPRTAQIVPKWNFPHEETYINDYSAQALPDVSTSAVDYPYICVFAGPQGPDNKLVKITSEAKYTQLFGKTNYAKYGQPHLMPKAILEQPNTSVWAMRVMPEDATYANSVLSLWYKKDYYGKNKFRIKFTTRSVGPDWLPDTMSDTDKLAILKDKDAIIELAETTPTLPLTDGVPTPDEEGYTEVVLAVFIAAGRGAYGQNLRWRITANTDMELAYGYKGFAIEILDVSNSITVRKKHEATFVSAATSSKSLFINDIVEDTDIQNLPATIHVFEENVEKVYDEYISYVKELVEDDPTLVTDNVPAEVSQFDMFFGNAVKSKAVRITPKQSFISFTQKLTDDIDADAVDDIEDYTATEIISVNNVLGINFENGSDGSFASTNPDVVAAALEKCYIDAFSGKYDKLILAPKRVRSMKLFDANYPLAVKIILAKLAMTRCDCLLYLDCGIRDTLGEVDIDGITDNFAEIDAMLDDYENFSDCWIVSIETQNYRIVEESTKKRVTVTTTYYLAATDAADTQNSDEMFPKKVGSDCKLEGHVKNSLKPAIEETDYELKEALNTARLNYFEAVGENQFERATQSSFVKNHSTPGNAMSDSDLLEENNVDALLWWKRTLEKECRENRYDVTTPIKRADFRQYLIDKYSYLEGPVFTSLDIEYKANEYESMRNIVHMYTAVQMPTLSKITLIEIDVNPREYEADSDDDDGDNE